MKLQSSKWLGVCAWVLAGAPSPSRGDVVDTQVDPSAANPQARIVRGPHVASFDPKRASQHRLVVFLNGAAVEPSQSAYFNDALASHGYHVISLDYQNRMLTSTLRDSPDGEASSRYHQAVVFGGRINDNLMVNPQDAIEARLADLLQFLAHTAPEDGWREFASKKSVIWSKVVLAGHSQGAGHAAYLAHFRPVSKVLLLAGPQDDLTKLGEPAPWLSGPSKTPRNRFRVLLHRRDEFDVAAQLAACRALIGSAADRPISFLDDPPTTVQAPAILVSERPIDGSTPTAPQASSTVPVAHNSLLRPSYESTWLYLLSH